MTAVETSCLTSPTPPTAVAGRATTLPAPSATRSVRKRYWEDTVHEAIAELRQRLGSNRETVSTLALLTIIEVEKHRMRHGRPVSGTETSHMREDEDPHPLPKLAPLDEPAVGLSATERSDRSASGPVPPPATTDAEDRPLAERAATLPDAESTGREGEAVAELPTTHPAQPESRPTVVPPPHDPTAGTICNFLPTDDRVPERRPTRADERRRIEKDREAYIECYGRYPEDDFPDNPDYHRFRDEPRPHWNEVRWLWRQAGIDPDNLWAIPARTPPNNG